MKAKSYNDWRAIGYQVKRGEKATGKDRAGAPTFTRDQVEETRAFDRQAPGQRGYNDDCFNYQDDDGGRRR
jgi:hypothetical protein